MLVASARNDVKISKERTMRKNWENWKTEKDCKEWPEAVEGWRKEGRSARLSLTLSDHPRLLLLHRPLASSWPSSPGRFSTAPKRRGQWDAGRRYWSEASSRRRPLQDARLARRERAAPQFEIKGRKPLLETSRGSFRLPCVLWNCPHETSYMIRHWTAHSCGSWPSRYHYAELVPATRVLYEANPADRKVCRTPSPVPRYADIFFIFVFSQLLSFGSPSCMVTDHASARLLNLKRWTRERKIEVLM